MDVHSLLRRYGISAKKGLGQNFLADPDSLQTIVEVAEVCKDDAVLEVGPGLGSLTRYLAQAARRVVAVELDAAMLPPLRETLAGCRNVEVLRGDILKLDPAKVMGEDGYLVVANIPYYITSVLIRHLLEAQVKPTRMVLTVQREVAERICAGPGELSLLALSVQVYGAPFVAATIPAGAFIPAPKVDSAVIRVDLYPQPLIPQAQMEAFFRLARAGFSQKRKTLRNALSAGMGWQAGEAGARLERVGIDPQRRAETLSLEEWGRIVDGGWI